MPPTRRFPDRTRLAVRQIQLVVTVIGVRLEDACVARQMGLRMLAPAVARVMEDRGGRPGAAERLVVANINPEPAGVGPSFCPPPPRPVRPVEALRPPDMGLHDAPA